MLAFFVLSTTFTGLALTYWYRDCDPMLTGVITRYDQLVPLYVGQHLAGVAGLRGLFLSGLVGASISTVSSVINSHAATFYVDIVSPNIDLGETEAIWVTHLLAGSCREEVARNTRLSSPAFLRLWSRLGLLADATTVPNASCDASFKEVCCEEELCVIPPLNESPDNRRAPISDDVLI
ncbi:hypothetical protein HPB52_018652 [Rhipicephalus sanguineus]|uniref:Uncharacterized protein n=1 Tax=Rhipicephalus sanguineus TaxID=34632 RepID=A0A9D4T5W6_RHISA|nr:hypothetical protein HPB52_018652 [Rhipicephalus sanguineus]